MIAGQYRKWWILGAMGASLGLIVLDETIVGVALPTVQTDLGMSQGASHWVVNAYLLVFTCVVAAGGKLGDVMGLDRALLVGLAIFALSSALAGFAPQGSWIVAARTFQGIGAGIIFPTSVAIVTRTFPLEQRGLALGIHTTIGGIFLSSGPLIGGLLTESISWRWVFWVNLPVVAIIALIVIRTLWREDSNVVSTRDAGFGAIDWRGLVLMIASLGALVTALMEGVGWGWTSPLTLALAAGGTIGLVLFVLLQNRSANPLMKLHLFGNATFSGSNLVIFTQQFSKITVVVFVALYLQQIVKISPIDAGALIFAGAAASLVTSTFAGMATDRWGTRLAAQIGLVLNGGAFLAMGAIAGTGGADGLMIPLILWGASLPWLVIPCRRAVMNAVDASDQGQAGGISVSAQMLGGTIAMAVCGTLLIVTDSFETIFLATGGWIYLVLMIAWFTIARDPAKAGQS